RWVLQNRSRDLPETLDPVGGGEERVVTHHHVVDQPLIGFERLRRAAERVGVAEVHVRLAELHPRPRHLGEKASRDAAGLAELEREVVAAEGLGRVVRVDREHPPRRLTKGKGQQVVTLRESLSRAKKERYVGPAPVVHASAE